MWWQWCVKSFILKYTSTRWCCQKKKFFTLFISWLTVLKFECTSSATWWNSCASICQMHHLWVKCFLFPISPYNARRQTKITKCYCVVRFVAIKYSYITFIKKFKNCLVIGFFSNYFVRNKNIWPGQSASKTPITILVTKWLLTTVILLNYRSKIFYLIRNFVFFFFKFLDKSHLM